MSSTGNFNYKNFIVDHQIVGDLVHDHLTIQIDYLIAKS